MDADLRAASRHRPTANDALYWIDHAGVLSVSPVSDAIKTTYPGRLYHTVPGWVKDGAVFHIRIRCDKTNKVTLTEPSVATPLLDSVRLYNERQRWFSRFFLLMPDHIHALVSFPRESRMGAVVGDWKRYQSQQFGIQWQSNFFDHRIRSDKSFIEKEIYIRRNPCVKGLCTTEDDWPWYLSASEGGR